MRVKQQLQGRMTEAEQTGISPEPSVAQPGIFHFLRPTGRDGVVAQGGAGGTQECGPTTGPPRSLAVLTHHRAKPSGPSLPAAGTRGSPSVVPTRGARKSRGQSGAQGRRPDRVGTSEGTWVLPSHWTPAVCQAAAWLAQARRFPGASAHSFIHSTNVW